MDVKQQKIGDVLLLFQQKGLQASNDDIHYRKNEDYRYLTRQLAFTLQRKGHHGICEKVCDKVGMFHNHEKVFSLLGVKEKGKSRFAHRFCTHP